MPSKSKAQHNFMAAVAHSPAFAKKAGVPQSVGKEFNEADKGRKFSKGGDMKESKEMMKKEVGFMKKAGAPKSMIKHEMAESKGKGYAKGGGISSSLKAHASAPASKAHAGMKAGGMTKMGAVKTNPGNINGIATKGKTKGTMVKMARGGKAC
jgi:hypothetical protein